MSQQRWYFTFMQKQRSLADKYVVIKGTYMEARNKMFNKYGDQWAFQYDDEDWVIHEDGTTQADKYNLTEIKL